MRSNSRIFTIGHSVHPFNVFVEMLRSFDIRLLADIRNFPGSKRYPHFNKENLEKALPPAGIRYVHLKALGGRRKPDPDTKNTAWRVEAFRGYADYMETNEFKDGFKALKQLALEQVTAYMCSEAVWWSCHRALVSDLLKSEGWLVMHIMKAGKAEEHPFTKPASIVNGKLTYVPTDLFKGNEGNN
jgi:uncharacterized protein (DUF488 family)